MENNTTNNTTELTELVEDKQVAPQSSNNDIMSIIKEAVSNPDISIEKMDKVLDLQERIMNKESEQAYNRDYVAMKCDLPKVLRTKKNDFTESTYAPLDDINTQIEPVLSKYGFGLSFKIEQIEGTVTATAIIKHKDNWKDETSVTLNTTNIGNNKMSGVHAVGTLISYAKRYAVCALLNVSTGDDTDGNVPDQAIALEDAIDIDNRINNLPDPEKIKEGFLAYMDVSDVRDILCSDLIKARKALSAKEKQAKDAIKNESV